jgi:hypothetical protein
VRLPVWGASHSVIETLELLVYYLVFRHAANTNIGEVERSHV